jgi:glutamine synthetase
VTLQTFLNDHPGIANVELVLTDPSGVTRGKWAPVATLKKAFAEGVNFPLSLHGLDVWGNEVPDTGLHISSGDLDGFCKGVPESLSAVPWGRDTAQVLLETARPDGTDFGGCARTVLRHAVERLGKAGLSATCAFEVEFHLLDDAGAPVGDDWIADAQFMYGLEQLADRAPFFAMLRKAALLADLPIDTIVKEAGPGQFEVNLTHRADPLRAADDVVLLKRAVRECARVQGLTATFMAKPFIGQPGNGLHVHTSFQNGEGANVFSGLEGAVRQRHAVAGLMESMEAATLVFINTMNGFRRMAPGSYAPTRANWGENNRSVALRLPAAPDHAQRVEHRVAGADANPYLVLACILQGMMDGLETAREPVRALTGNAYEETTPNCGESLPADMPTALALFRDSAFIQKALGGEMRTILSTIKAAEIAGFADDISPLERRTYL